MGLAVDIEICIAMIAAGLILLLGPWMIETTKEVLAELPMMYRWAKARGECVANGHDWAEWLECEECNGTHRRCGRCGQDDFTPWAEDEK